MSAKMSGADEPSAAAASFQMNQQYSSTVFLAFAIGNSLYNAVAFYAFSTALTAGVLHGSSFSLGVLSIVFRFLSILALWLVWILKPDRGKQPYWPAATKFLFVVQTAYPILISAALSFRLVATLLLGDCSRFGIMKVVFASFCDPYYNAGGVTMRLAVELMFNPILTAFLLRDTPYWALITAWVIAVVILVTFAIVLQSSDIGLSVGAYVFCTALIFMDSVRQSNKLKGVLQQLQEALVANEHLARQEQAQELRAMMGNMAHDLKTVSCIPRYICGFTAAASYCVRM
jgi:signal transduction histidine kinase